MRRLVALGGAAVLAILVLMTASAAFAACEGGGVGAIDAEICVAGSGVSAEGDAGAVDAQGDASRQGGGATADAGAIDAQAGTDRKECADAGSIDVLDDCPPQ